MRPRKDGTLAQAPQKRRLTELLVKRQRPAAAPFLIWDTKQAGLVLRVQPTGQPILVLRLPASCPATMASPGQR